MRVSVLLLALSPSLAWSATLTVPTDYATVGDALAAAAGGDTVSILAGTYEVQASITGQLTIAAAEAGVTLTWSDDTQPGALFTLMPSSNVTFVGMTLTNPNGPAVDAVSPTSVSLVDVEVRDTLSDVGGAVRVTDGALFVTDSSFSGNLGGDGGAISVSSTTAALKTVNIAGSTFSDNLALGSGGHLHLTGALNVTLDTTQFSDGGAIDGGAVWLGDVQGIATFTDLQLFDNAASGLGGAVYFTGVGRDLTVRDSVFIGNGAEGQGGGLAAENFRNISTSGLLFQDNLAGQGGAIYAFTGRRIDLDDALICRNGSLGSAGGVYAEGLNARLSVLRSSFVSNFSATNGAGIAVANTARLDVVHSLLLKNQSPAGGAIFGELLANLAVRDTAFSGQTTEALRIEGTLLSSALEYDQWFGNGTNLNGTALATATLGNTHVFEFEDLVDDALGTDCTDLKLWPRYDSPLVDAGTPNESDPDGSRADIGPYGGPDANPDVHADTDGDGAGAVRDCDDTDDTRYPEAEEVCDSVDQNCDNLIDNDPISPLWYEDADGDGFGDKGSVPVAACTAPTPTSVQNNEDCDDTKSQVSPDASELCDGIDNDCDGSIDANATDEALWYADNDGDGYGRTAFVAQACTAPAGYVALNGDCDDVRDAIFPGADELCNSRDDNCDGAIDENGAIDATPWFPDADGDGFGTGEGSIATCNPPGSGFAPAGGDCDDAVNTTFPGAEELCNSVDDDCDGTIDIGPQGSVWYPDADGDGAGDSAGQGLAQCDSPGPAFALGNADCNDTNDEIGPQADEICDGIDNDCDGLIDDPSAVDALTFYFDTDSDGFGDPTRTATACARPPLTAANADDCDDRTALVSPSASELCNGRDDNCDGVVDEDSAADATTWYVDSDDDGWGDDNDPITQCAEPAGYTDLGDDCDDDNPDVSPIATELCNGADDDCDGNVDEPDAADAIFYYEDADGDGFGNVRREQRSCDEPAGFVNNSVDCDDTNETIFPGSTEVPGNLLDENCDGFIDRGDLDEDPEDPTKGCGCDTSTPAQLGWFAFLLAPLLLRRRR